MDKNIKNIASKTVLKQEFEKFRQGVRRKSKTWGTTRKQKASNIDWRKEQ